MRKTQNISIRILAFAISLQVFNISLNQNDYLLGKMGNGFKYINEIETVVEFIVEYCITGQDIIPETQVPGGTLGFEEEEKHLQETTMTFEPSYIPDLLYNVGISPYKFHTTAHVTDVTTPPPQA